MLKTRRAIHLLVLGLTLCLSAALAHADMKVTFCVFDPLGKRGEAYAAAQDQAMIARQWGVTFDLKAYNSEKIAAEDFKAGQCDGVALTTLRGREFNTFTGSIDAVGAVPTASHLRQLLVLLANPKMASRMISGSYETVGIVPLGEVYLMTRDRASGTGVAGKRVAVFDWDKSEARLVQFAGAQAVSSDLSSFASKFNNGEVDMIAAPAVAYQPLELHKGIGRRGAIYRFPVGELTASLIIRRSRFPPGFGQKSRAYAVTQLDKAFQRVEQSTRTIPASVWQDISATDQQRYTVLMREARIQLIRVGDYNPDMMRLLKNLRCHQEPDNAECSLAGE
jgi:hypothetical protein